MSPRAFRILLVAWLTFEIAASLAQAFFAPKVQGKIVLELYDLFGQPVPLPQSFQAVIGIVSVILFIWAVLGLFLFWRGARLALVAVLLVFAAGNLLRPVYVLANWDLLLIHLRLLFHGFLVCLTYFGPPREFFARHHCPGVTGNIYWRGHIR